MAKPTITPTGQERVFADDELIVSKTDPKGIITYANDVFQRVSGYANEEVLGQAHNLIRHPSMPRGVFHLLWETITQGRELFAFIDNLASDGAHYWVLAHVTPTFGPGGTIVGYHSNRRVPERHSIEAVTPLYRRMLATEARSNRAAEAAEAGARLLVDELAEEGMVYDEYVWRLIVPDAAQRAV